MKDLFFVKKKKMSLTYLSLPLYHIEITHYTPISLFTQFGKILS